MQKRTIDPKHKLPCDFIIGPLRFRKGVKLDTVRLAAQRWFDAAVEASNRPISVELDKLVERITPANVHEEH